MNNQEKVIKDAQYRKGLSIAFFNATNAAIALCQGLNPNDESTVKRVIELRDLFLEEHKNYYAAVIAQVGVNYSGEEAIKKLKAVKSKEELHTVWLMFSEDERHDLEIAKCALALKAKYEKPQ